MKQNGIASRAIKGTKNTGKAIIGLAIPLTRSFAIAAGVGIALHLGLNALADATSLSSIFAKSGTYLGTGTAFGVAIAKEADWNSAAPEKASLKRVGINTAIAGLGSWAMFALVDHGLGAAMALSFIVGQTVAYGYNRQSTRDQHNIVSPQRNAKPLQDRSVQTQQTQQTQTGTTQPTFSPAHEQNNNAPRMPRPPRMHAGR